GGLELLTVKDRNFQIGRCSRGGQERIHEESAVCEEMEGGAIADLDFGEIAFEGELRPGGDGITDSKEGELVLRPPDAQEEIDFRATEFEEFTQSPHRR